MLAAAWNVALHPLVNLAALAAAGYWVTRRDFFVASVAVVAAAVVYIVLGPRVKRNRVAWSSLPRGATPPMGTNPEERAKWPTGAPLLYVVHGLPSCTFARHAIVSLRAPEFDTAVVCIPPSRVFRLPLSRAALWWLGGVLPYTRTVLQNLLRRSRAPTVLVYPTPPTSGGTGAGRSYGLLLDKKGVFAAALRHGSLVVPCLSPGDGRLLCGAPVGGCEVVDVPAAADVTAVATAYAGNLQKVADAAGVPLRVTA